MPFNKKGEFTLERPGYSGYPPIKLNPIKSQLPKKFIESGAYYYEWTLKNAPLEPIFTIENLEITLPQ